MLQSVVVLARLLQFMGATVLFGSSLFYVYGLPRRGPAAAAALDWPRPLLAGAALMLLVGGLVSLSAQTAMMTGQPSDAFDPASVWTVVSGTQFGLATVARLAVTAAGLTLCALAPSRSVWLALSGLGALALASFAWTGHGADDEGVRGLVHIGADMVHLWAAGIWLGALAVFALLLSSPRKLRDPLALRALHQGLEGFSGVGTAVVAALVASGLVNSWFLVGPTHIGGALGTAYGMLLAVKLIVFVAMLALAAVNRFILTPGLAPLHDRRSSVTAVRALRRSLILENGAALAVIVLVSIVGTLAPLAAS